MNNPEPEFRAVPTDFSQDLESWEVEEEWEDAQLSSSWVNVEQMAEILYRSESTDEERQAAVEQLSLVATNEAINVLRRYRLRCYLDDEEVEAAIESGEELQSVHLSETPLFQRLIQICEAVHDELGPGFDRGVYKEVLAEKFDQAGLDFRQDCRARMRYHGELVGESELDFVIEDTVLVGVMGDYEEWTDEENEDTMSPRHKFYADLRIANLPKGLLADFSQHTFDWRAMYNVDVDRGVGVVEYEIWG